MIYVQIIRNSILHKVWFQCVCDCVFTYKYLTKYELFVTQVGRIDLILVLDCEENTLRSHMLKPGELSGDSENKRKAISSSLQYFQENTLPLIKEYDDQNQVIIVSDCTMIRIKSSL